MAADVLERQWPIRTGLLLLPAETLQRPLAERGVLHWGQLSSGEKLTMGFNMLTDAFGASDGLHFIMRAAEQAVPAAVGSFETRLHAAALACTRHAGWLTSLEGFSAPSTMRCQCHQALTSNNLGRPCHSHQSSSN